MYGRYCETGSIYSVRVGSVQIAVVAINIPNAIYFAIMQVDFNVVS